MAPKFGEYPLHVQRLIRAALDASDPSNVVRQHLRRESGELHYPGGSYGLDKGRVFMISIGKASVPMAAAAAELLADHLSAAVIVAKKSERDWSRELISSPLGPGGIPCDFRLGGHPVTDEGSLAAAAAVCDLLAETAKNDLVLCCLSGGASALFSEPLIPLNEWRQLNLLLLESGCTINEMNCVRRQLDRVKGGGLARCAAPAPCVSLILSDVIGNALEIIGSGPTVLGQDQPRDALDVLRRYQVDRKIDKTAWKHIEAELTRSEASIQPALSPLPLNTIVGDIKRAAEAVLVNAAQIGFLTEILSTHLEGEAREAGRFIAAIAKDLPAGRCLIFGGETTVTIRGDGRGGRNQEMALSAAIALEGIPDKVVVCFATDGEDGPTDAAGAMVTGSTVVQGRSCQLDALSYLDNNDSYNYFSKLEEATVNSEETMPPGKARHMLRTGPTGTNVNDLVLVLSYQPERDAVE